MMEESVCSSSAADSKTRLSLDLISTLHAGVTDKNPWSKFLAAIRKRTDAVAATLILQPSRQPRPDLIFSEVADGRAPHRDTYRTQFWKIDPFINLPTDTVLMMDEFLGGTDNFRASSIYREHLAPADVSHVMGMDFRVSPQISCRFRLSRSDQAGPFGREERALCAEILPHLRSMAQIVQRLAVAEAERSFFDLTLERLKIGVVIVDQGRNILTLNDIARDILGDKDGIGIDRNRLSIADRRSAATAYAAINTICSDSDETGGRSCVVRIERDSGRPALGMVVKSMPHPSAAALPIERRAIILLSDPERASEADAHSTMALWSLTRTESLLSAALVHGSTLDEASERMGISRNTARAHLRSIFAKTGVHRQSELSRLMMGSIATLI